MPDDCDQMPETAPEMHPVQTHIHRPRGEQSKLTSLVTRRAYEVYCEVYSPQQALIEGNCRGGFAVGELIAFLYARSFPKNEWLDRVDEALRGMRM